MNKSLVVVRTVRKGKVKVYGQIFTPDENFLVYDGRLDNQRFAFNRYKNHSLASGAPEYLLVLSLSGTEAAVHDPANWTWGPELVDGRFPWVWWRVRTPNHEMC